MNCAKNKTNLQDIISKARDQFDELILFVTQEASSEPLNEVERGIFRQLLAIGRTLLSVTILSFRGGDVGLVHTDKNGVERKRFGCRGVIYHSIFGKLKIDRIRYWNKGVGSVFPLDAVLNLPANSYSYLLQEWGLLLGVEGAWNKTTDFLKRMLGVDLWSSCLERIASNTARDVDEFYKKKSAPDLNEEGELLVVTLDGKGVPIKKEEPSLKKVRLKKGEKPGKKKMSTVTAIYTIDRHEREVDDIVKDTPAKDISVEGLPSRKQRPLPKNKIVKATLEGKEPAVEDLVQQVKCRDPQGCKEGVALMDGEPKLRELIATYLPSFCIILDLYHVLEYIWKAAHVFYSEGSKEATRWVQCMLKLLLQGGVEDIILYLRGHLEFSELTASKHAILEKVIGYLDRGKAFMRYDCYLAKGYPIGSGVIEGACRNLVKDRLELVGMRWSISGAESMLRLRSVTINGLDKDFWKYRIEVEKQRLYGKFQEVNEPLLQKVA